MIRYTLNRISKVSYLTYVFQLMIINIKRTILSYRSFFISSNTLKILSAVFSVIFSMTLVPFRYLSITWLDIPLLLPISYDVRLLSNNPFISDSACFIKFFNSASYNGFLVVFIRWPLLLSFEITLLSSYFDLFRLISTK